MVEADEDDLTPPQGSKSLRVVNNQAFFLVECKPYNARVTETTCVDRYHKARGTNNGKKSGAEMLRNAEHNTLYHYCRTCPVGAVRAKNTKPKPTVNPGNPQTIKGVRRNNGSKKEK